MALKFLEKADEKRFRKLARWGLLILVLLTGWMAFQASTVYVDYDFEKFFPEGDPETKFFLEHRQKFESDNDFLLIAIENHNGIYDWDFLEKVKDYQIRLNRIDDILYTQSLVSESEVLSSGAIVSKRPLINFEDRDLERDQRLIRKNVELQETFVAKNEKSLCIFLKHTDYLSLERCTELLNYIQRVSGQFEFDKLRIAGRLIGQQFYIDKMKVELVLFLALSFVLVCVFLYFAFRSLWGLLMPLMVLLLALVWIVGFMGWIGEPLSVMMTTLPSIMFVVAVSDVIHFLSRYLDLFREIQNKRLAIIQSIREVGLATFLTSLTTAIGFFTLLLVSVQPIQVFGVIAGYGVLIAFGLTFVMLPILIFLLPTPKYLEKGPGESMWTKLLNRWFVKVIRNRKVILIIGVAFVALFVVGANNIIVNNYIMDELSDDEPMKVDFNFLDENYGGVRPLEIAVMLKDSSDTFWSPQALQDMEKVEGYLTDEYGATVKISFVKMVKVMNRSMHSGSADYFKLPSKERDIRKMKRALRMAERGGGISMILDSTKTTTRISGAMPDWGSLIVNEKNKDFEKFLSEELKGSPIEVKLTGTAHLFDQNISYLSVSMVRGLSLSVAIVAIIMGLLYQSWRMVLISLVPNLIPLIFVAGVMGFCGIELKTSTAIIFTIAFGIAVDDTIHFLGKFKHELLKGKSTLIALRRSFIITGKAMILTSAILCGGFMMLMLSTFQGTFWMGALLCLTLFVALIADLTILPILLLLIRPERNLRKKIN